MTSVAVGVVDDDVVDDDIKSPIHHHELSNVYYPIITMLIVLPRKIVLVYTVLDTKLQAVATYDGVILPHHHRHHIN